MGFVLACVGLMVLLRPLRRAALLVLLLLLMVSVWWLHIPPRNDRDWQPDVERLPSATITGHTITVRNIRNFEYFTETEYREHWETRTYDLDRLQRVDLFLCFWGPALIAHSIVSWGFSDGSHLAVSIETRKEKGESYSAVRGFFRQYELYYVVADERDVVRLRTNYRGETVYLYRIKMPPERARELLIEYLKEINLLAERPRWYNALTHNCTTMIRYHVKEIAPKDPWSWKILVNGFLDELAYERGRVDTSLPFAELRKRSDITGKAGNAGQSPDFSRQIRQGLPDWQ